MKPTLTSHIKSVDDIDYSKCGNKVKINAARKYVKIQSERWKTMNTPWRKNND